METTSPVLNQNVAPLQKLLVAHSLLDIPVLLVEQTLQRLVQDLSFFESALTQLTTTGTHEFGPSGRDTPAFYAYLFKAVNNIQANGHRTVEYRGISVVGETLRQTERQSLLAEPDITYLVRGFGDFSMIPAEHFKPTGPQLILIQLPKGLIPFARWLIGQKNWIIRSLSDCYFAIGKAQAAFLLNMDPGQLAELPVSKITYKLNLPYNTTTYWRLLQNRCVKIISPVRSELLPISDLLPTREDILKYFWIPKFNSMMQEECLSTIAYSDDQLATRIEIVARRTVAKYRELANIPSHSDRERAYKDGRNQAFSISTFMTRSKPTFDEKTPAYPYGYGRCECGCNTITHMRGTQRDAEWVWLPYVEGHEPRPNTNSRDFSVQNRTERGRCETFAGISSPKFPIGDRPRQTTR